MARQAHPSNENEFEALMERVDLELRTDGTPIEMRVMRAESVLAVALGEPFVHPYPRREPHDGVYSGDDLTIRVERWFDRRYGSRQEQSFSPGSIVVLLRGDPWLLELPRLIGSWDILASRTLLSDEGGPVPPGGAPPSKFNIVESIKQLASGLKESLTDIELVYIHEIALLAFGAFHRLERLKDIQLIWEVLTDHAAAVRHLIEPPMHFGQAKWASLQAGEKSLKSYIIQRGEQPGRNHDLARQAEHCIRLGLPPVSASVLAEIQCDPGVRYGNPPVTLDEAIAAHHSALAVSRSVAHEIARALGRL